MLNRRRDHSMDSLHDLNGQTLVAGWTNMVDMRHVIDTDLGDGIWMFPAPDLTMHADYAPAPTAGRIHTCGNSFRINFSQ